MNEVLIEGLPLHPLKIQRESVNDWRQIGLGVMSIGDMLIKLGIKYGTPESLKFCDEIGFVMADTSINTSALIARDNGYYPKYKKEAVLKSGYLLANTTKETRENIEKYGLANSQILTIAPNGSLSTMLGTTGGIEPIFATHYNRKTESLHGKEVTYKVYTPIVQKIIEISNLKEEDTLPDYIVTSMDLNYKQRIDMQSIWQKHIDASISSTCNVPEDFTVEQVKDLYMYAWEKQLKGITLYRSNCRRSGILTTTSTKEENTNETDLKRGDWKSLAEDTIYIKKPLKIGCGNLKLFVGYSPSEKTIQDLYIKKAGNGGCTHNIEAVAVGLSAVYRLGGSTKNIEKAFSGLGGCNSFISSRVKGLELSKGSSCATAILNILKEIEKDFKLDTNENKINKLTKEKVEKISQKEKEYIKEYGEIAFANNFQKCPLCGEHLENSGGCKMCPSCAWSKCE